MFFDYREFFRPAYLLTQYPGLLSQRFFTAWMIGSLSLIIVGVGAKIIPRARRLGIAQPWVRWWRRLGTVLIVAGILAFLLLFFRYERVPFFSSRFWMIIWFVGVITPLGMLAKSAYREIPSDVALYEQQRRLAKYLP